MIYTAKEIKQEQLNALIALFRSVLGLRLRRQSYQLHDVFEVMKKQDIKTNAYDLLIVFDSSCAANITKYQIYKTRNPLVWFFYFGLEEQPIYTIDFFYRLFFQDKRFLQPSNGIELNIDYEQSSQKDRIHFRNSRIHDSQGRELGMGSSQSRIVIGADSKRITDR